MRALLALFVMTLVPIAAGAQEFTPQHVAKLRMVTEAVIAPDGTRVAYVLSVPRDIPKEKDGPAWSELHVVDTKGNQAPFITGPVNVSHLAWTPDGKSIAFLAKRDKDEHQSLYVIGASGGEARKLLGHSTAIQGYSFSGDGKQVAFLATEPPAKAKKTREDQGFNQEIYEEDQPLVRVWVADVASRERKRPEDAAPNPPVANAPGSPWMVPLKGSASELHFNPKEDKLAVALAPDATIDAHLMFRKVHIVDLARLASLPRKGGEDAKDAKTPPANAGGSPKITNLNNPGKLGQIAWSPDGKKLAIITGADKHDPKEGRLRVYVETEKSWLEQWRDKVHYETIAWESSKENFNYVCTICSTGVATRLRVIGADVAFIGETVLRSLVASNLSIAALSKRGAFIAHTSEHPPEVYLVEDVQGGMIERRRLTDSNPWLKSMQFAKQEVVKYKARDGLELEGILVRPLNEEKGKRYPLVVTVHGGPEAHYSNGWVSLYHSLGQVAAAKGMAVFYPNYRGSTGRGVEFSMMGQKAAAGKEFDDIVDGVDHLIKIGLVDEKKVGITGGSYGGYATAWGATYYSHRFAAGVMFVGLSDLVSCAGTTDIPHEMTLVHHRQWLWDDWNYFLKASPIYHLEKAKTPLLICHGKADPRVHPSQSLELYRHLKVRGQAPVRLVLYPGEGHGNRRGASRLDYNLRLLQWMEHYLKGPGGAMPPMELDYGLTPATKAASWDTRGEPSRVSARVEWTRGCPCCIGW